MTKTILIVEDENPLRNALKDKLNKVGFATLEAKNGQEGLELAISKTPDLILLDIIMPVMDGFTMVKKLREEENKNGKLTSNQIPILFLTNLSDEKALSEGQQEGIYDYLVKSNWTLDGIVKKIDDKLNLK